MSKIYGYKEEDVIKLAEFLVEQKQGKLTEKFEKFARQTGKAKGTVRNLYYALAKMSQNDLEFCKRYFNGQSLKVDKIVEFSDCEERQLIKQILLKKSQGQSVRSAIKDLSLGDEKTALRYQNKYRNAVMKKPELINEIKNQLKKDGVVFDDQVKRIDVCIDETQFLKVKKQINQLVLRISSKERKENEYLRAKVEVLEKENLRLSNQLYGKSGAEAIKFFRTRSGEGVIH